MGHKDHKKEKKQKHKEKDKSKKRRRERSSSPDSGTDSDEARKRQKAEKMAKKVAQYWDKQTSKGVAPNKFVWVKKVERDLQSGKSVREFTVQAEAEKHRERMSEIEKVQKRREEKEAEKARMEEELALLERQRLAAEAAGQEEKEEEFHLEQAVMRSDRRLAQGRPRPVDFVARALYGLKGGREGDDEDEDGEEDAAAIAAEPYLVFEGLLIEDIQELADDIKGFKELDVKDPLHADFWGCMHVVAAEELSAAQRRDADDRALSRAGGGVAGAGRLAAAAAAGGGAAAMPAEVRREIEGLLAGQTHGELRKMEGQINASLAAGEGDPDYWEAVLERLQVYAAKARLREIHADLLRRRIEKEAGRIDVAEIMGWAAEEAAEGDEGAAEARRAAAAAALAAAEAVAAAAVAAAAAEGEEEGAEAMDVDRGDAAAAAAPAAAAAGAAAAAAPGAPARGVVNEEEIPISDDEEEAAAAAAATAAAAAAGPEEGGSEGEEPASPRAREPGYVGIGAEGGPRDARNAAALEESDGRYSPPPVNPVRLEPGAVVVAEEEDARTLALLRQEIKLKEAARYLAASEASAKQLASQAADRAYQRQFASRSLAPVHPMLRNVAEPELDAAGAGPSGAGAAPLRIGLGPVQRQDEDPELRRLRTQAEKVMAGAAGEDEEAGAAPGLDLPFGGEVGLGVASQAYWWHNKYAPRKPKYFNRIHTGYEWNKYNQTHYDTDNPPPKVVQGYKFNIFYPDLIDKKATPSYKVEPDPSGSKDTCILVFTAGPPYEDIAFRIVNKEWETTHRRGFKCTYERGILHLYFNFKRARYRR